MRKKLGLTPVKLTYSIVSGATYLAGMASYTALQASRNGWLANVEKKYDKLGDDGLLTSFAAAAALNLAVFVFTVQYALYRLCRVVQNRSNSRLKTYRVFPYLTGDDGQELQLSVRGDDTVLLGEKRGIINCPVSTWIPCTVPLTAPVKVFIGLLTISFLTFYGIPAILASGYGNVVLQKFITSSHGHGILASGVALSAGMTAGVIGAGIYLFADKQCNRKSTKRIHHFLDTSDDEDSSMNRGAMSQAEDEESDSVSQNSV